MNWINFVVFGLGLCLGSFYNVCIVRFLDNKSIIWPPSQCPKCGHRLKWWENIPVLSFILLRGRCSSCQQKISWLYPCVEILSGILTWLLYLKFKLSLTFFLYLILFGILLVASFIDLKSFILPDVLTLPGGILALLVSFFLPIGPKSAFLGAGLGFFLFWLVQMGYRWLKGIDGLGGGDVKLMIMLGAMVGVSGLPWLILLSSLLGILGSIILMIKGRAVTAKTAIPFGPFLSLATVLYVLGGEWLRGCFGL